MVIFPSVMVNILSGTNCRALFLGFRRLSPLEAAVAEAPGPGEALRPLVAALGEPWPGHGCVGAFGVGGDGMIEGVPHGK